MSDKAVAGIDIGHSTTKIVVLKDGKILYKDVSKNPAAGDEAIKQIEAGAHRALGLSENGIEKRLITGAGARWVSLPKKSQVLCLAKGVRKLFPQARTIIDTGSEMSIVLKLNEEGRVMDIVENDKCAAGVGVYYEAMAKLAGVSVDTIGGLALQAQNPFEVTSTCVIFAEQEVITRVHENPDISLTDIMGGICNSMAMRVAGLARRVGITEDLVVTGGVARNEGYVKYLGQSLGVHPKVPEFPELVIALGAALYAQEAD